MARLYDDCAEDLVRFFPEERFRSAVAAAYAREAAFLRSILPFADVQHVGSTAVPGSLTKGDLDIQVRVSSAAFPAADQELARWYRRNARSAVRPDFSAFEKAEGSPSVGIQLTVAGGELDVFWRFREVLRSRPDLVAAYDQLKRNFEGRRHRDYRAAKDAFFERLRDVPEYRNARLPSPTPEPTR